MPIVNHRTVTAHTTTYAWSQEELLACLGILVPDKGVVNAWLDHDDPDGAVLKITVRESEIDEQE